MGERQIFSRGKRRPRGHDAFNGWVVGMIQKYNGTVEAPLERKCSMKKEDSRG